jgi:hypothetical protein
VITFGPTEQSEILTWADPENAAVLRTNNKTATTVLQAQHPDKSTRHCPRETGVSKISANRISQHKKIEPSVPRMSHAIKDDSDRRVKFC